MSIIGRFSEKISLLSYNKAKEFAKKSSQLATANLCFTSLSSPIEDSSS